MIAEPPLAALRNADQLLYCCTSTKESCGEFTVRFFLFYFFISKTKSTFRVKQTTPTSITLGRNLYM